MTGQARSPSESRFRQADRLPVSDYHAAVYRLVMLSLDDKLDAYGYDQAVMLVADIFWLTDVTVRRDVIVAAAEYRAMERAQPRKAVGHAS